MAGASLAERPVVLFDFDGTVVDTGPAVLRVARETLWSAGYTDEQIPDLTPIIGPPIEMGFMMTMGVSREEADRLVARYREIFAETVHPGDYPPPEGMVELLRDLTSAGRRLAVATSRLERSCLEMLRGIDLDVFEVVCGRVYGVRETKADSIRGALAGLHARPEDAVMVGDRFNDVEGAHEVGLPCVGIYSGAAAPGEHERAGAEAICHSVEELRAILLPR